MSTFVKTEVVDARQFTGDTKNARELVAWANAHEHSIRWQYSEEIRHNGVKIEKVVTQNNLVMTIQTDNKPNVGDMVFIAPTSWVLIRQDGRLDWRPDEVMKAEFEQK